MTMDRPGPPLRIAFLGDFDGPHTRRWLRVFVACGHDVHAIAYYQPESEIPGVTLHVLSPALAPSSVADSPATDSRLSSRLPPSFLRFGQALRYKRAGLKETLAAIRPDIFHAHYAVEHGFYGAFTHFHPYVVSCWGSDILIESHKPLGRFIARHALRSADTVTANDPAMASRIVEMGIPEENVALIRLGVDPEFLERSLAEAPAEPIIISDRALEPLYNVDVILRAFAGLRERLPAARLLVAHDGSQRRALEVLARELNLGDSVSFLGRLTPQELLDALVTAAVYVSVPSSDSLALSTMEAMAAGAFPVVSDLPSQDGWITHGQTGLRVPAGDDGALADAFHTALTNAELRQKARVANRRRVEMEGNLETNMLLMERYYYVLAGRPLGETI
ncbi:MAG: glycosyltransferase [Dehalococcoidia bacterium]|nr:glycosyltransferase [Dehalococcoidia bacterium]